MKRSIIGFVLLLSLMVSATPQAFAADTAPPKLVDWAMTLFPADISVRDAVVTAKFIISDDSEIVTPRLLLRSLSTGQVTELAVVKEVGRSGKLVSYEATATIKVGQSPRFWEWVMYPLQDSVGNVGAVTWPEFGWQRTVVAYDKTYGSAQHSNYRNCLSWVKTYNNALVYFYANEKLYPGNPHIELFRFKYITSTVPLTDKFCESVSGDIEYTDRVSELVNGWNILGGRMEEAHAEAKKKFDALLKIKQEADAKAVAEVDSKAKADAKAAELATAKKKKTITCIKGKLTKKVTSKKPVCPSGYRKK